MPQQFAPYEELLTDAAGAPWPRDFVRDHEDDGLRRWTIHSADGTRVVARMEHSARFDPVRVHPDFVLGVERDEIDVERVALKRIVRPLEAERRALRERSGGA